MEDSHNFVVLIRLLPDVIQICLTIVLATIVAVVFMHRVCSNDTKGRRYKKIIEKIKRRNLLQKTGKSKEEKTEGDKPEKDKESEKHVKCEDSEITSECEKDEPKTSQTAEVSAAASLPPRPALLQGTNINSGQFVSILYNMLPLLAPPDVNKDVVLFNAEVPLVSILNFLDPQSFLRMAAACKKLRKVCYYSKQICINFPSMNVGISTMGESMQYRLKFHLKPTGEECTLRGVLVDRLKKLPFMFHFDIQVKVWQLTEEHLRNIKAFFDSFRMCSIERGYFDVFRTVDWAGTLSFVQDYRITNVDLSYKNIPPQEFRSQFLNLELKCLHFHGSCDYSLLEGTSIPDLVISQCALTIHDLHRVIQAWLNGTLRSALNQWLLGRSFDEAVFIEYMRTNYDQIDWNEEELPANRPLVVTSEIWTLKFWMVNEEDKIMEIVYHEDKGTIELNTRYIEHYPRVCHEILDN